MTDGRFIPMPARPALDAGLQDLVTWMQTGHEDLDPIIATALAQTAGARGAVRDIADLLIGNPYVNIPNLRDATALIYQAVSNAVRKLEELGILEQRTVPGVMAFRAPEVVAIISAPSAG